MSLLAMLLIGSIFLEVVLVILLVAFILKLNNKNTNPGKFGEELSRIKEQIERK